MYLKRQDSKDHYHYVLCESYRDDGYWRYRELLDLGPDPNEYIVYPGGNSFHIRESLEETLRAMGASYSDEELEDLFLPFMDPYIRGIVERFKRPRNGKSRWKGYTPEDLLKYQRALHPFDKRRLHYLRCGRVDMGNLEGRPWGFLNVLLEKSRDEIEHVIEGMEQVLTPDEIRAYLYTAMELQTYFPHHPARNQPVALDPEKVDHYFLKDLCRLNRDEMFFRGVQRDGSDVLHPYLVKYLILFFDHPFDPGTVWDEYVQDFRWRHQFHRTQRSHASTSVSEREACQCLGISPEDFQKMERRDLIRCYRKLAKETHPDRGGDKGDFVEIKEAYECLLMRK
ncbi:MAG: DnaJ domain-containing protein [Desulfobacteraceae bacterium]